MGDPYKEIGSLLDSGEGKEEDGKLDLPWVSAPCHPVSPDASLRNWGDCLKLALLGEVGSAFPGREPEAAASSPQFARLTSPHQLPLSVGAGHHSQLGQFRAHSSGPSSEGCGGPGQLNFSRLRMWGANGVFGGWWGSLGRAGCREAAFEPSGRLH